MLATVSDHSRSPVFCAVATMRPAWPTANTTPPSMAGRAASLMALSEEAVRVRASDSDHTGWPLDTRSATRSPVGIGHDHDVAVDGGAGVDQDAGALGQAAEGPQLGAVGAREAEDLAFLGHDEHALAGRRRRGAHRRAEVLLPELLAGLGVERDHVAEAGRGVDAAAVGRQAAAEAFLVLLVGRRGRGAPGDRAAGRAEGRHLARGIEREHLAVVDDRAGRQLAVEARAGADARAPRGLDGCRRAPDDPARCWRRRPAGSRRRSHAAAAA